LTDSTTERSALFEKGGHLYMVVAAVFTGVMGAIGAVAFRLLIRFVQAIAFEGPATGIENLLDEGLTAEASDPLAVAEHLEWYWRIALPMIGGLLNQGMNPAAALAFLVAGPVTTLPAMAAVWPLVVRRVFVLYVSFALGGAVVIGCIYRIINSLGG